MDKDKFAQVPVKSEMFWSCCSHSPVPPSNPKTTATISSTLPKTTTNPKSPRFLFQSGSFLLFSLHQNDKTQPPETRHHPLQPPTQSPTPQDKVGPQWSNPFQGQASLLLKDSTPTFYLLTCKPNLIQQVFNFQLHRLRTESKSLKRSFLLIL